MSTSMSQSPAHNIKLTPSQVLLALLWSLAVVAEIVSLLLHLGELAFVVGLSSFLYIVVLIWTLSRKKPSSTDLPNLDFLLTPRIGFGVAISGMVFIIGIMFVIGMVIGPAMSMLLGSALIGLGITVAWRSQLTTRIVWMGISVGLIAGLGITFLGNGDLSWAVFNLITLPPLFTGGALLISRTRLVRVRLLENEYALGLKGFLWACILSLPAALLNLLGNMQQGDTWVTRWWQPLYAIVPGVAEETWARLFLTTLCYALLRPTTNQHPRRAVFVSLLVGALVHGFAHTGINPIGIIVGCLLYGIPTALLFIKYDFEHAVGYHFLIDLVRFAAALFQG